MCYSGDCPYENSQGECLKPRFTKCPLLEQAEEADQEEI